MNAMTVSGLNNTRSGKISIGLDNTTTPSRFVGSHLENGGDISFTTVTAHYAEPAGLGYRFLAQLEKGEDSTSRLRGRRGRQ